jgi:hypothetical protein
VFHTDSSACTNANNPNYHYLIVGQNGMTADGLDRIYAAALAAAAAGKVVQAAFDDSTSNCYINRLSVIYD